MTNFVSLHNQTSYSLLDSLVEPKALFKRAKELGQIAVSVTDHGTLGAMWDAWKASKDTGVKLIAGCECYFLNEVTRDVEGKAITGNGDKLRHLVLLAKNAIGYRNLLTLNKKGFDQGLFIGKRVYSVIDWKLLEQYSDGLICLTACGNGILSQLLMSHKMDEAERTLIRLRTIFGDNLGIEVQPNNMKRGSNIFNDEIDQFFLNRQLVNLGKKHGIRVVAACNTHYLTKEESKTHDVFLAIGSHQPIYSNYRLRYTVPEFYLKTGDEVKAFFTRNYGEETAQELCDNSLYFANMCENPDWIDPKFSNPSGKELPVFPVKDEPDYQNFLTWLVKQEDNIRGLDEDKQFLRYKCAIAFDQFKQTIPVERHQEYIDRINTELEVLEYQGFSSYMLIVGDYIEWCKKTGIPVGPGRGCLTGDTQVLTTNGFKDLDSIKIGDEVYTHTGRTQRVLNTFKFDVANEQLLKVKTKHSFGEITLTKNHKVYAYKSKETTQYKRLYAQNASFYAVKRYEENGLPEWIEVNDLRKGDVIYTTFPDRENVASNLPKNYLLKSSSTKNSKLDLLHTIEVDENFMYFLGRFVGDGWIRYPNNKGYDAYTVGIAFNSEDVTGIKRFQDYFTEIGLRVSTYKHKTKKLIQLMIHNKSLVNIIRDFLPDYKNTSNTKHLPIFFRNLSSENLIHMLNGVIDSDGHRKEKDTCGYNSNRINIDSTSKRLILELKELLLLLKVKSSVSFRKELYRGKYLCKKSYKLRFNEKDILGKSLGYYSQITQISEANSNHVYDITVDQDHSYLTSNYIVHNSVGGCFIGFLLGIHEADSLKYGLIFERFQNKLRTASPDCDQDVSTRYRNRVLEYLRTKYGDDHFCAISNYNTITPKVYMRDICRALELGDSKEEAVKLGNDLAAIISPEASKLSSFDKLLSITPMLSEYAKRYPLLATCGEILGKPRNVSTHAAGIVISARPLVGLVPLRKDNAGTNIIEYDKDNAEANGMIKMDVLGLSSLDMIEATIRLIKEAGKEFKNEHLNYDAVDLATYELISKGDNYGVFQLGTSGGTIELCKKIKPHSIEDLAIITTLARPAAANIRNDFIQAREGKKSVILLHPSLEGAFKKTYGFGLFDESILQIGRDVAGWDYNDADRLRKMIKEKGKNPEKEKKLRLEFIEGAIKQGIQESLATRIWDEEISKFASYTFNKSHAVVYSFLSYQTAYLKAHYPVEFLMANLMAEVKSNTPDARSNIEKIKKELRKHKVKIVPPDINKSELVYTIEDGNRLITGLDAIKFVGDDAIKDIIEKRPFKDFFDFMSRVSSKTVRANSIQALAACGALDSFKLSRRLMFFYCSDYRKKLQVWLKKHNPEVEQFVYPYPNEPNWTEPELYALEQYYLGESFVCKPAVAYGNFFKDEHALVSDIKRMKDKTNIGSVKGIIRDFFEFRVKKEGKNYGKPMVKATLEDKTGEQISLTIFPDSWKTLQERIPEINRKAEFGSGIALHFTGNTNNYEDNMGIILDQLFNLTLPPSVPVDLKAKKINLKEAKAKSGAPNSKDTAWEIPKNPQDILDQIEDNLFDEGLIDLDADFEDD